MLYTYRDMYNEVIESGKYPSRISKLKQLAQLIHSNDRRKGGVDCAWEAIETFESMTGVFFDPTQSDLDDIVYSII